MFARFKHIFYFIYKFKECTLSENENWSDYKWIKRELWIWFSGYDMNAHNHRNTDYLGELIDNI